MTATYSLAASQPMAVGTSQVTSTSRPRRCCLNQAQRVSSSSTTSTRAVVSFFLDIFTPPECSAICFLRCQIYNTPRANPYKFPTAGAMMRAEVIVATWNVNSVLARMDVVMRWLGEARDDVLLCGDFNVAPEDRDVHDPELWRGKILFSKPEREAIEEVRGWGFTDAFRMHHQGDGFFSWWDYRAGSFRRNTGLRIDHMWVSEPLAARCKRAWIDKGPRGWERPSDHTPVLAEFTKV